MSSPRRRVPYFNVPASQQPLRIRARDVRQKPREPERRNPLEELVIGSLFHPLNDGIGLFDEDRLEAMDAAHEDLHGRLPHQPGYEDPGSIWAHAIPEAVPVDPGEFEPEPDTLTPEPELIPDWVLADARDLAASGMTLRRIATAVLPETGCPDVPSCVELLDRLLTEQDGPASVA